MSCVQVQSRHSMVEEPHVVLVPSVGDWKRKSDPQARMTDFLSTTEWKTDWKRESEPQAASEITQDVNEVTKPESLEI